MKQKQFFCAKLESDGFAFGRDHLDFFETRNDDDDDDDDNVD